MQRLVHEKPGGPWQLISAQLYCVHTFITTTLNLCYPQKNVLVESHHQQIW